MRLRITLMRAALGAALIATGAVAATPQETIAARQQHYKQLGRAFKIVNDELRKPAPALAIVRPYAAAIERFGPLLQGLFPAGTGPEAGVKTAAKPEIWTNRVDFARKAADFRTAGSALARVSRGTNVAAITAATRAVGGTCKNCHDSFRAKDD